MSKVFADISVSLDGFVAGPKPTLKEPLGKGGEQVHEWVFKLEAWRKPHGRSGGNKGVNDDMVKETVARTGAVIMGRKMFSGGRGPWNKDSNSDGWWGDTPPFHVPVFILTHHQRETVNKKGGTTFTFITTGIEDALNQAKKAAGKKDIQIAGGASAIQQYMQAGHLDELQIHISPVLLASGTRLFDNLDASKLEKVRVIDSPDVTHIKFKIKK